jgi:hypothetical protein
MTTDNPTAITLRFTVHGVDHVVRSGQIDGLMSRELRHPDKGIGVGFPVMLDRIMGGDLDTDYVAGLLWLARRQAGERVALVDVLASTTFDDVVAFAAQPADDGDGAVIAVEPGTAPHDPSDDHPLH